MKTSSPNQLQFKFSFTNPTPAVLRTLATLVEISEEGSCAPSSAVTQLPLFEEGRASDNGNPSAKPEQAVMRATLRRLAGCTVLALHKDWHTVWVEAYHEFFKVTGMHPVSMSVKLGLKTHLDFIFTNETWPAVMQSIFEVMLEKEGATA